MDTTVGALKVGAQLVMGKYGVDKDNPYPIVWLKGNPNCDFITEKAIDYLCFFGQERVCGRREPSVFVDSPAISCRHF